MNYKIRNKLIRMLYVAMSVIQLELLANSLNMEVN